MINLFYEEPNPDRWFKYDRYPRKWIRRLIRGKQRPGGVMMVALELMRGLDLLGISYRFNDYKYARKHPQELIGVIGKPHLIYEKKFKNPVLFGSGVYSHPVDCPDLFKKYPNVRHFLVPGKWMEEMCRPYYGNQVEAWPVGIDTEKWNEKIKNQELSTDFLIYDKVRWEHDFYEKGLINPIINILQKHQMNYENIRYGYYNHQELTEKLSRCKAVIFLCEHETQGLAYQQILATGTPILAWDRGGFWQDPAYYPTKVKYEPVSSVPYWDERCGLKFKNELDFELNLIAFTKKLKLFKPRDYVLENLTLEKCANWYVNIYKKLEKNA
ncbi:MAG: hypothetical protein ABIP95_08700 [Pelobium sp.]